MVFIFIMVKKYMVVVMCACLVYFQAFFFDKREPYTAYFFSPFVSSVCSFLFAWMNCKYKCVQYKLCVYHPRWYFYHVYAFCSRDSTIVIMIIIIHSRMPCYVHYTDITKLCYMNGHWPGWAR